ncbi:MAG: VCBS repeat-containing protein [Planctomycetota bacterium]|nr:VCBS repeat-containing protein [Planctomycetota bacterium]
MMTRRFFVPLFCLALTALADETPTGPAVSFTEHLIADKYGYAYGVAAADLDGDGDLDLTSCDTRGDALYWFENDGRGMFQRHFIQADEAGWFERHAVGDINGDKLPDVVVVKNLHGHLVWFENSGRPADDKSWKRHVVTTDLKRAYDAALVDLNGDGRLDVAASAWNGNHIAWFANPGSNPDNREWKKEMIDPELAEARTIRVADFNGDGKPDILSTGRIANLTAWYEQTGVPDKPWKRHVIDDKSLQPVHGQPIDMDGDGDADVVMGLGMLAAEGQVETNQIAWYENVGQPGTGETWKKHVVGPLPFAFEAVAADLDGDRDLDIVATAWGGVGQLVWFENGGDPKAAWTLHLLKDKWPRANQPIVADLNGDRRPDIIATAENGANELRWWQNTGAIPVKDATTR